MPQFVSPAHQRHIGRMFLEGVTNHPGVAVGRPHLMGNVVLLKPQDLPATFGEMVDRGAAHAAYTEDYGVIVRHGDLVPRYGRAGYLHPHAEYRGACGEQHRAVVRSAPGAVGWDLRKLDDAQVLA